MSLHSKNAEYEVHARAALFPLALVTLHQLLLFAVGKEYTVHESGGIVVTGASTGIGRHAALALAKKGFVVYAGCRKVHSACVCSTACVCGGAACVHSMYHMRRSPMATLTAGVRVSYPQP